MSIERYVSLPDPGRILPLSFWRDEDAVARWRNLPSHRTAQAQGRTGMFAAYRLRVAQVTRDDGLHARDEAPCDARAVHG